MAGAAASSPPSASTTFRYSPSKHCQSAQNQKPVASASSNSNALSDTRYGSGSAALQISKMDSDSSPANINASRVCEQPLLKPLRPSHEEALGLPKLRTISSSSYKPKYGIGMRRCRVCQPSHNKNPGYSSSNFVHEGAVSSCQLGRGPPKGSLEIKGGVNPTTDKRRIGQPDTLASDASSSSNSFGTAGFLKLGFEGSWGGQIDAKLVETAYNFSIEVANAIKRIESGISALQLFAEKLDHATNNPVRESGSPTTSMQATEDGVAPNREVSHANETSGRYCKYEFQPMDVALQSQSQGPKANGILERFWRSNQAAAAASHTKKNVTNLEDRCVHRLHVPANSNGAAKQPPLPKPAVNIRQDYICDTLERGKTGNSGKLRSRPPQLMHSKEPGANNRRNMAPHLHPNPIQIQSTLLGNYSADSRKVCSGRRSLLNSARTSRQHVLPLEMEDSEEMDSLSSSSSYTWSSQQQTSTAPSSYIRSNSGNYSLPSSIKSSNIAATSSSPESTSSFGHDNSGSSSSRASTSYPKHEDFPPRVRRDGNKKLLRSRPEKQYGGLKRLKDKLGLIFHHQHHHHHHHHHHQPNKKSMWKSLHHVFGEREATKDKFNQKKAVDVERVDKRKSVVKKQQKQVGHFQALVEGLTRHVRHNRTKKSKPFKGKKGVIQQRKGKVKLGFVGNKKSQLRQLKRIT